MGAIGTLIHRGQLKEYVGDSSRRNTDQEQKSKKDDESPPPREIRMIYGGLAGGESIKKRKVKTRETRSSSRAWKYALQPWPRKP